MEDSTVVIFPTSKDNVCYGNHTTKLPTMVATVKNIINSPRQVAQIYVSNSRGYSVAQPTSKTCLDYIAAKKLLELHSKQIVIHSSLIIQLTSQNPFTLDSSRNKLLSEMDIGVMIGAKGVVVHFGRVTDLDKKSEGFKKGVKDTLDSIKVSLTKITAVTRLFASVMDIPPSEFVKRRRLLLENSAGEGRDKLNKKGQTFRMGHSLKEIGEVINKVPKEIRDQVGVCFDTAHSFGAGQYDLGYVSDVKKFYEHVDKYIPGKLWCIHLNDSKVPKGCYKDRHWYLGHGHQFRTDLSTDHKSSINEEKFSLGVCDKECCRDSSFEPIEKNGFKGLKAFVASAGRRGVIVIGENPNGPGHWMEDYCVLNELLHIFEMK